MPFTFDEGPLEQIVGIHFPQSDVLVLTCRTTVGGADATYYVVMDVASAVAIWPGAKMITLTYGEPQASTGALVAPPSDVANNLHSADLLNWRCAPLYDVAPSTSSSPGVDTTSYTSDVHGPGSFGSGFITIHTVTTDGQDYWTNPFISGHFGSQAAVVTAAGWVSFDNTVETSSTHIAASTSTSWDFNTGSSFAVFPLSRYANAFTLNLSLTTSGGTGEIVNDYDCTAAAFVLRGLSSIALSSVPGPTFGNVGFNFKDGTAINLAGLTKAAILSAAPFNAAKVPSWDVSELTGTGNHAGIAFPTLTVDPRNKTVQFS